MPVLANVKGIDLPFGILKKLNASPYHTFRITPETEIEYDDEGNPMPPENQISDELIKAVETSEKDYKEGRFVRCETEKEVDDFYNNILIEK